MKIIDYIKREHKNIMQRSPKERWAYFWEYYKLHAIIFVLVIGVLVQTVVGFCNRREIVFSGFMLNSKINVQDRDFLEGFYQYAGIDDDTQEAAFYTDVTMAGDGSKTDITAFQRIMAGIAIKDTDFIAGPADIFRDFAYNSNNIFVDLRTFLNADTLEKLSGRLYYIDTAVLQQLQVPVGETIDYSKINYPDPLKPETMTDPIPVAIDISDREALHTAYYFPNTTVYLGVIANTPHPELVRQLIDYLWT